MPAPEIAEVIASIGALGTASYGLVDAAKFMWNGGPSSAGFGFIRQTLAPFAPALTAVGYGDFIETARANWLNGAPLANQKAKAKALIHLGLTGATAPQLASATGMSTADLSAVAAKIDQGVVLEPKDVNLLGRFDAIVEATLDAGFERADQRYRNTAKALASGVSVVLAIVGGAIIHGQGLPESTPFRLAEYYRTGDFLRALFIGLLATPLAPVAKDLSSALVAAVTAVTRPRR